MTNNLGKLFVITGPSGAGKDSVIESAREQGLEFAIMVTTTTRAMRPGEAEGKPYYFITESEFRTKIDNNEMIEYAEVYGNLYGSTKTEVERVRKANDLVIIKVDPQGARTFKEMLPEAQTVFIKPPTFDFLEKHLVDRGSDSPEVIKKRLKVAQEELENIEQWDHVVVNEEGKLDETAQNLIALIHSTPAK